MRTDAISRLLHRFVMPFTARYWIEKWDWMIYRLAHKSIRRMCERNGGFAYLFELWIRQWRKEHPIPASLESATEHFFESTGGSRAVVDEASCFRSDIDDTDLAVEPTITSDAMNWIDEFSYQLGERIYGAAFDKAKADGVCEVMTEDAMAAARAVIDSTMIRASHDAIGT